MNSAAVAPIKDEYFLHYRSEMLGFVPSSAKTILEFGCGMGVFGESLKKAVPGRTVWGVELDPEAAVMARTRLDKVLVGDAMVVLSEIPDQTFDCIVMNDVLEHLVDPYTLLAELKRTKLKKDGVIVASIPNVRYIKNVINFLIRKDWEYEESGILDRTHLRFFTKRSIQNMFRTLGYDLLRIEGVNPCRKFFMPLIEILTLGFMSDCRYLQFACVARPK